MKVTKCNIAIKCDVDGCGNLATQDISFDGKTVQMRFCDKCFRKIREAVAMRKNDEEVKNEKDKTRK